MDLRARSPTRKQIALNDLNIKFTTSRIGKSATLTLSNRKNSSVDVEMTFRTEAEPRT